MFCWKCGANNADDAIYCNQCGADIHRVQPVEAPKGDTIQAQVAHETRTDGVVEIDAAQKVVTATAEIEEVTSPLLDPTAPSGMGGWLLYFCISLTILNPAYLIIQLIVTFTLSTDVLGAVVAIVLTLAEMTYFIIIGIRLWQQKENAVRQTKIFLIIIFVLSIADLVYLSLSGVSEQADAASLQAEVRAIPFTILWFIYFSRSKRVKNTFKRTTIRTKHYLTTSYRHQ